MKPLFIDTDTGSDDAVALMLAFSSKEVEVVGVGMVAGNVSLEQATRNALFIRDLCGKSVEVFTGADKPLVRPLETAVHVHGSDGMGDCGLVKGSSQPSEKNAALALIKLAHKYAGELNLVTLGPLTNIAIALSIEPKLASLIKRCVIMGGTSDGYGNITPVSEFNFWVDPEAADLVLKSGMNIEVVGWDISRKYAVVEKADADRIVSLGTEKALVAISAQGKKVAYSMGASGLTGFDLPDPIAMAIFLEPEMVQVSRRAPVHVATCGGPTRGMMIIDDRNKLNARHEVAIVEGASHQAFLAQLDGGLR